MRWPPARHRRRPPASGARGADRGEEAMTGLELHPDLAPAPTTLFASASPAVIVARATEVANAIAPLIRDQNLVKRIGQSEHVFLEGWTLAGTMLGVFPITVASGAIFGADGTVLGYEA